MYILSFIRNMYTGRPKFDGFFEPRKSKVCEMCSKLKKWWQMLRESKNVEKSKNAAMLYVGRNVEKRWNVEKNFEKLNII